MLERLKDFIPNYVRSTMQSMVKTGVVASTSPASGTARVEISDEDGLVSFDLGVIVRKTYRDKDYWMPDAGDQVLCLFLPFGLEQGFILGSFYSQPDAVPVTSQDKRHVLFGDGTWLEYDRKSHTLSGHVKGKVDQLTVDEDVVAEVGGSVQATVTKDVIAEVGGSVQATVTKDLIAEANNAEVTAKGSYISLSAPLIKLQGSLSAAAQGGGTATETKEADTEHTGSYTLTGDLEVDGNIHATGDILADGSNSNHHTH
jgi:phage baseplate assembly protein V